MDTEKTVDTEAPKPELGQTVKSTETRDNEKSFGKESYESENGFVRTYLYVPICFLAYLILDFGFRFAFRGVGNTSCRALMPNLLTVGWALVFCGIIILLPRLGKRIFFIATIALNVGLCITHGIMYNIFQKFFSFADLGFAGDGFAFLEPDYIKFPAVFLIAILAVVVLSVLAFVLFPKKRFSLKKAIAGTLAIVIGAGCAVYAVSTIPEPNENFAWDNYYDNNADYAIYDTFDSPNKALMLTGLYHYTFRNLVKATGWFENVEYDEYYAEIDKYNDAKEVKVNDDMTGLLKGQNLIMIQLEAIDTWMLTEEYMPNLYRVKSESVDFQNYFSSIFIPAGTFNAEFTANTGLIPSMGTVSQAVYTNNAYPYSMANLFRDAGYTSNSFHGSEGSVYNRGAIHENLGFEKYYSGTDMKMDNYQMDRYLMNGYEMYAPDDKPFFSFIITFSGHGPYNAESLNTSEHIEAAKKAVDANLEFELDEKDHDNYYYAIAHAMETDMFVGELFERLEKEGMLDNTAVIFYTDHQNYYYNNEATLNMFKGAVDSIMAQNVPFFIYSKKFDAHVDDKAVSGIDILPTVANLFGLDADFSYFIGDDMFGEGGGYVPFKANSWFDGTTYYIPGVSTDKGDHIAQINKEVYDKINICSHILKCDYYEYASRK